MHSCTPSHLLDEGVLANGRLVFASVPHADSSHATVLDGILRCAMREICVLRHSTNYGRSPSSIASEGQAVTWKTRPPSRPLAPSQLHASHNRARITISHCRTLYTLGTFTPPLGSTRTAMDISRNLPSLLVKGRNVCRVERGMSCERVSTLVALCMWRLWTWKRRLGVPHRVPHASVNSHVRQLAAPRSCPLVTSIDETGSLTCPLSLLKFEGDWRRRKPPTSVHAPP